MAFHIKNYSPYWKQFSEHIRFERAKGKCEQCGIPDKSFKLRGTDFFEKGQNGKFYDKEIWSLICLTVAHLDYDGGICQCKKIYGFKCAKPSHVLALCNACHLEMDRPYHIAKRRENLTVRKDSERGLFQI